jgi:hypothetical protein
MIPNNIKDICELFDCRVCTDLCEKNIGKKKTETQEDYLRNMITAYYIGEYSEHSAGLNGYALTPSFFSLVSLEKFCHSSKGREIINKNAGLIFTDWSMSYQCWFDKICDGCFDIRGINASEHKCHSWDFGKKVSDYYIHRGDRINDECQCPICKSKIKELRRSQNEN